MEVQTEMRSAVRFPLRLPVSVMMNHERHQAMTRDISAGGVLLDCDISQEIGAIIEFTICMPAEIIGAPKDVLVNCTGRVVRCSSTGDDRCSIAAIIEDYSISRNS